MAKWGKVNFEALKRVQQRIEALSETANIAAFCEACCKELAARLLALVIPATPVGQYPKSSGKKGGTLRRGWGAKTASEAKSYVESLAITKTAGTYSIEIVNPVEYASYVEYGHRTADHKGWVEGRYMLSISEEKLKSITPALLERKLNAYLKEIFNA